METDELDRSALSELESLALAGLRTEPDGFSLDLTAAPARWDAVIRTLGRETAYSRLAALLCEEFRRRSGRDFLFSDACVAFELGYHIDAYLWTQGYPGYPRHITTRLFTKAALDRHCSTVDISEKDLHNLKQRVVFGYKNGLRGR